MNQAENAKIVMLKQEEEGEALFLNLLARFGPDGMIYYKRGLVYEELGRYQKALDDFELAKVRFFNKTWIDAADNGIFRMKNKLCK
jgi:tetratricopeptide (TPR) repeat protein